MSSGHQRIKWRRNIAENFNRLSRVHERYRQTDDRQTDGRTTTYSEREQEFTFAKNYKSSVNIRSSSLKPTFIRKRRLLPSNVRSISEQVSKLTKKRSFLITPLFAVHRLFDPKNCYFSVSHFLQNVHRNDT